MNAKSKPSFWRTLALLLTVFGLLGAFPYKGFRTPLNAQADPQTPALPKDKTVVDMTVEELLQCYPAELRQLEFSRNQDPLDFFLAKIGERVQAFFRDFSNTSSKENVFLQRLDYKGHVLSSSKREFRYLIVYHPGEDGPLLEEYRTDKKNRPVGQDLVSDFFITSGYACFSLNFHPSYQHASRFRYCGREASDARDHILAFAQKPDLEGLQIELLDTNSGKLRRLPVQGLAWISPDTYQILRLQIDLLSAGNQSMPVEQTTDIQFSEVRFDEFQKRLWLPREVVVTTRIARRGFRNLHQYSEYRLFSVESDYKIDTTRPRK